MATTEDSNVRTVLTAFDTLFNKRDYVAAERFWSANYIQHSAHIPPGRDGLIGLIKPMPATRRSVTSLQRLRILRPTSRRATAPSGVP